MTMPGHWTDRLSDYLDREPVQPGAEGRIPPEGPELLPGADEHVLGDLVRLLLAQHAPREGVDPGHMGPVEPLEGMRVPGSRQGGLDCVGIRSGPGRLESQGSNSAGRGRHATDWIGEWGPGLQATSARAAGTALPARPSFAFFASRSCWR